MMISKQPARNVLLKQSVKSPASWDNSQKKGQRLLRTFYFPQFLIQKHTNYYIKTGKIQILPILMPFLWHYF